MPHLDGPLNLQGLAAFAQFALAYGTKIRPLHIRQIARDVYIANVKTILIRARCHPRSIAELFIGEHGNAFHPHRAETARMRAKRGMDFLHLRRAKNCRAQRAAKFGLIDLVVAAHQHDGRFIFGDENQRFDLCFRGDVVRCLREVIDGLHLRRGKLFQFARAHARGRGGCALAVCLLEVGGVRAVFRVRHFAFARGRGHHKFVRMFAAHYTGVRLHRKRRQAASFENLDVRIVHFLVTHHRRFIGNIEAVRVFHYELPRAHQPKARADFIPKLSLDLVKINGCLPIRMQLR